MGERGACVTKILLILLYISNITAAVTLLFSRRRSISSTLSWLLAFTFLPYVGFVLYFFFGSTAKLKLLTRRLALDQAALEKIPPVPEIAPGECTPEAEQYEDLVALCASFGAPYVPGNRVELLPSAQEKYARMFAEMEQARESICVLYFIIKPEDEVGARFIDLLARKAREGVRVRFIYDTLAHLAARRRDFAPITEAGGEVYPYLPSRINTLAEVNYRMHRKIVVIDGKIAYTGGINIGDDYLGLDKKITPWRDTSVRITGPAVRDIQLRFVRDCVYLDRQANPHKRRASIESPQSLALLFPPLAPCGTAGVQIVTSGPSEDESATQTQYMRMISSARRYIYIQTPYFVPDDAMLQTIRAAARSGIDVRVMIPGVPDKKYAYAVTTSYIGTLLEWGCRVFVHHSFLHAKTFVMDDAVASVGTTNLDVRSFHLDFEINALVYDRDFAVLCRETFERDMANATEMTLDEFSSRGLWTQAKESFWRLIAPLL